MSSDNLNVVVLFVCLFVGNFFYVFARKPLAIEDYFCVFISMFFIFTPHIIIRRESRGKDVAVAS